jgi:CHAT domain
MVLFALVEKQSYVAAITRDGFDWKQIPLGADALSQKVAALRKGLDVGRASDASGKSGLFDLALANELYATLLGSVEPVVKDKRSLLVVPSGALTALPFHLLVMEKPAAAIPDTIVGYRDAAWLVRRHAVSVLPSVASLKALRGFVQRDQAIKPMTGFGDPLFNPAEGGADKRAATTASRSLTNVAYTDFWRGVGVDREKLALALPQLPDTADELNAVAKDLGAAASDIHLGSDASETTVKRARLADYRIVYFATHGLVAGDVKGLAEPARALHSGAADRPRRWPAHRQRGGAVEAQCRLGGAVGLQHHRRRPAGRGSPVGPCASVLLCRRPRAAGDALGGRFRGRHAADDFDFRSFEGRSETRTRGSAAPGHAGLSRGHVLSPQRISSNLGPVCPDRRGPGAVNNLCAPQNLLTSKICSHRRLPRLHCRAAVHLIHAASWQAPKAPSETAAE